MFVKQGHVTSLWSEALQQIYNRIKVLQWPSPSPDLNLIKTALAGPW